MDIGDAGADGAPGEGDRLSRVENLFGGRGADRLAGDKGPNLLAGHGGRDRLIGRSGADAMVPGTGGGPRVSCGSGLDRVAATSRHYLLPSCEEMELDPGELDEFPATFTAYPTITRAGRRLYA